MNAISTGAVLAGSGGWVVALILIAVLLIVFIANIRIVSPGKGLCG